MDHTVPETVTGQALALFELPLNDLLYQAHTVHRQNFDANRIQASTLLNIKTGGCSEDCSYCARTVAVARILMPAAYVRLSAGRESLDEAAQALCFFAGANSVFLGERLLTTSNRTVDADTQMFERLGIHTG